jgi:heptosyltransferase-1
LTDILFIKTSSLGDVIHHMPAVSDVRAHLPQTRIAWVVEEAYAPLVALHPAVAEVVPVAWRRWRHAPFSAATWHDVASSRRAIAARRYDAIVDTQGLIRTALTGTFAHGPRHGYDRASIREPLASWFYNVRHRVPRDLHAVERNRTLTGLALGYRPEGAPDYGLDRTRLRREGGGRYALLLHATARPEKEWAPDNWIALGTRLASRGVAIVLPWGNERERSRATALAAAIPDARVADRLPLDDIAKLIAGAQFVVGVDTGLVHLAAALAVPLVAIFVGSRPELTRPVGSGPIEVLGGKDAPPSMDEVAAAVERVAR